MKILAALLFFLFIFGMQIFFGNLIILSFERMVPARWIRPLLPPLQKGLRLRWLWPLGLIGFFAARAPLFAWAHSDLLHGAFQHSYYAGTSFVFREIILMLIFFVLARRFERKKQDSGGFALVILLLGGSLFAIDWLMSLDPNWVSTAFGLVFLMSCVLTSYSLALLFSSLPTAARVDMNTTHFALIGTWCYVSFCQFLVVWVSNLPAETHWYMSRNESWGGGLLKTSLCLQLLLPMPALLIQEIKESPRAGFFFAACSLLAQIGLTLWLLGPWMRGLL
jgi:hypothetical protein